MARNEQVVFDYKARQDWCMCELSDTGAMHTRTCSLFFVCFVLFWRHREGREMKRGKEGGREGENIKLGVEDLQGLEERKGT